MDRYQAQAINKHHCQFSKRGNVSEDCSREVKDAQFIANVLIKVGPKKVVQVITDNAPVCKATGLIVESRFDHIFWTPCIVQI